MLFRCFRSRWLQAAVFTGLLLALAGPSPAAEAQLTASDPVLESRVNALAAELRCLVCQNQSLADSRAELAVDLKNQVREQLKGGRTDREVIDYMTARYGDFVLYRPPVKAKTLLLWGGPLLLVLVGGLLFWHAFRAMRLRQVDPLDPAVLERLESLLDPTGDESVSPIAAGGAQPASDRRAATTAAHAAATATHGPADPRPAR